MCGWEEDGGELTCEGGRGRWIGVIRCAGSGRACGVGCHGDVGGQAREVLPEGFLDHLQVLPRARPVSVSSCLVLGNERDREYGRAFDDRWVVGGAPLKERKCERGHAVDHCCVGGGARLKEHEREHGRVFDHCRVVGGAPLRLMVGWQLGAE